MKHKLLTCAVFAFSCFAYSKDPKFKNEVDQLSYSLGASVGLSLSSQKLEINPDYYLLGLKEGLKEKLSLMSHDEIMTLLTNTHKKNGEKRATEQKQKAANNLVAGEKFLAANKKKEGVKTLDSGLQYRVINKGKGLSPKLDDTVNVHYRGTLIDGTEFDSSLENKKPSSFLVKNVIPGWQEALQLMKPGAKWELFIPAKLAYGERSGHPLIGPNETLLFETELISVDIAESKAKK